MADIASNKSTSLPLSIATATGNIIDKLSQISGQISGILMLISCLSIFYGIVSRAANQPTPWSYEIVIYLMMWFISLALSFTQKQKANIELDLFTSRLSKERRETLMAAAYFLSLVFSLIFAVYSFRMFYSSFITQETGAYFLTVQLWWVKLAFFVGTVLLTLQTARLLISQCYLLHKRSKEDSKGLLKDILITLPAFAVLVVVGLVLINVNALIGLLVLLFVLLVAGVPIGFSLGLVGAGGLYLLFDGESALAAVTIKAYSQLNSFIFIALPLYIFAGGLMQSARLAEQFFKVGSAFLGHLPGGLGVATIFACALFAAINGSSAATAATIGLIAIPQLMKYGYSKSLACGMVATGGTLGILIPPSNSMILIGAQTGESVGKLFMAGVIPGIMLAILLAISTSIVAKGEKAPSVPKSSWSERGTSVKEAFWVLLLPLVILVPIYTGLFTVTESAAVAVIYALVIGFAQGTIKPSNVRKVLGDATTTTGMIFMIIIGALTLGFLVTRLQGPQHVVQAIITSNMPGWLFIVIVMGILVILGMFLEGVAINMMVIPLMILPLQAYGYSMMWFAVLFVLSMELAAITPPVALNIFIVQRIGQASLATVMRGLWWYYVVIFIAILIVALIPIISLWLPSTM